MTQARLLFNPNAGRFPPEKAAEITARRLEEHGWTVEILPTESAEHVTELAREAAEARYDAVIIAGGDGSVGRAAAGLHATQTSLAVLPTGTANVYAKELGLPSISPKSAQHIEWIADLIANSRPKRIDVGTCNKHPFLLWAGIGLDALIVRQSEQKRSHLKKMFAFPEYGLRTLRNATSWPGVHLQLEAEQGPGQPILRQEGRFQLAVITNIRLYAGGLASLSPHACINDGLMDLWLFQGKGFLAAIRNAWQLIRGSHVEANSSQLIQFSKLTVRTDLATYLHTDGDPLPENNSIQICVQPQNLPILLPETAPKNLVH